MSAILTRVMLGFSVGILATAVWDGNLLFAGVSLLSTGLCGAYLLRLHDDGHRLG